MCFPYFFFFLYLGWHMCVLLCVCVLSRRLANTLSLGGNLIYKALNEGQQRRRARTSLWLIVCLFTFTFLFHSLHLPPSTHVTRSRRRRRTRLEIISSMCKRVFNKSKLSCPEFYPPATQTLQTGNKTWNWNMLFAKVLTIKFIFCPVATLSLDIFWEDFMP